MPGPEPETFQQNKIEKLERKIESSGAFPWEHRGGGRGNGNHKVRGIGMSDGGVGVRVWGGGVGVERQEGVCNFE